MNYTIFLLFQNNFFKQGNLDDAVIAPKDQFFDTIENFDGQSNEENPDFLENLLQSANLNTSKSLSICVKPIEILMMTIKYCFYNNSTYKGFLELLKMFNVIFNDQVLPESLKFFEKLFDHDMKKEFHAICPFCDQFYLGRVDTIKNKLWCKKCKVMVDVSKPCFRNFFVLLDLGGYYKTH